MLRNILLILVALCVSSALCSPPVWGAGEESQPESGDALKKAREDLRKKDDEINKLKKQIEDMKGKPQQLPAGMAKTAPSPGPKVMLPAAGQSWTNSLGMEFVLIPAGTFMMGCTSDREVCDGDEKPRHSVRISQPFYLGKYEVTQKQWQEVMGSNPSRFKEDDRPVENVSWNDIQDFIKKLNAREGHSRYRLPTEAEWEYAARAGSGTVYSFGDDAGQLENYAWFGDNSIGVTHPVGKKAANAWGLHDIHGNVWEWVQDWYGEKYYSSDSVTDPSGPKEGENRVVRGGNWSNYAKYCRAANRGWRWPDYHDINLGFRLALSEN